MTDYRAELEAMARDWAHVPPGQPSPDGLVREFLDHEVEVPGKGQVRFGEMTVEDHQAALHRITEQSN
jgi:hypothetical protein